MAKAYVKHDYAVTGRDYVETSGGGGGGGGVNYSTEEQDTGITWTDGKPIYQKTVEFTTGSSGTYLTKDLEISGVSEAWIDFNASGVKSGTGSLYQATAYDGDGNANRTTMFMIFATIADTNLSVAYRVGTSCASKDAYVTVRYTKTE